MRDILLVSLLSTFGVLLGGCGGVYDAPLSEPHPERGFLTGEPVPSVTAPRTAAFVTATGRSLR